MSLRGGRVFGGAMLVAATTLTSMVAIKAIADDEAKLPFKSSSCLTAKAPHITDVGTAHAKLEFAYKDSCTFPAQSSVEFRGGDDDWQVSDREHTSDTFNSKDGRYDFVTRNVRLGGLRNNTRYRVRTRIDYLEKDDMTDSRGFRTGGDPARDLAIKGKTNTCPTSCSQIATINFSALVPTTGGNQASIQWGTSTGYGDEEQFPDRQDNDTWPKCDPRPDDYFYCTWRVRFAGVAPVGQQCQGSGLNQNCFPIYRNTPRYWFGSGQTYHFRALVKNDVYSRYFGTQRTEDVELKQVGDSRTEFEAGRAK
jgi:hypothetical protein